MLFAVSLIFMTLRLRSLTTGVHAGWSKPPPREFMEENLSNYLPFYEDFSKLWHHAMKITYCRDPLTEVWSGVPFKYPTNSYYPPGTICASELNNEFCPTSGESGSPLMVLGKVSFYTVS